MLPAAAAAGVGIIARVPLASGLLSGKYDVDTTFAADDHRSYNRDGSAFDVGETFSGVDYRDRGRRRARVRRARRSTAAPSVTPAQAAIAWIWQQPGVSTVIPGARDAEQARANAAAGAWPRSRPSSSGHPRALRVTNSQPGPRPLVSARARRVSVEFTQARPTLNPQVRRHFPGLRPPG